MRKTTIKNTMELQVALNTLAYGRPKYLTSFIKSIPLTIERRKVERQFERVINDIMALSDENRAK